MSKSKTAMITGISGMDSVYLAKYLLDLDYNVIGILRRNSTPNNIRLHVINQYANLKIVYGDITDAASISRVVSEFQPDEFYSLAANSFVGCSWDSPSHVLETNTIGTINCLEALRQHKKDCRFYFAGSSEMYGDHVRRVGGEVKLNEDSPMIAASPYGVSKVGGYQITRVYRESYDMFAACGILFNHCAPLRGTEFFTRKVTSQLARIKWGLQSHLFLGNLDAKRDEGSSVDYVRAMHYILQHTEPDDFVIATGQTHSCREWLTITQEYFGLNDRCIAISEDLMRPNEVHVLIGDASKALELLGWCPKITYERLNYTMCQYDDHLQSTDPDLVRKAEEFIL